MKQILKIWLLLSFSLVTLAQNTLISPNAKVALWTIKPGNDLYSGFGHSAIFVMDTTVNPIIFKAYNYGTFNFDDPDFYLNFCRGKLKYMVSIDNPNMLLNFAAYENRTCIQQTLDLSYEQKQKLYAFLEWNVLPENKFYQYDFFYDNCSSRIRDVLKNACGDKLIFNLKEKGTSSFRQLIDPYLEDKRVQDLGMDLGMGSPADVLATPEQELFLPDYLSEAFAKATIDGHPLVKETKTLFMAEGLKDIQPFYEKPLFYTTILLFLVLVLTYVGIKKQKLFKGLDVFLFFVAGIFGLVLFGLWFFTDHSVTKNNMNLIWANPLMLVFMSMYLFNSNAERLKKIFLINFFALFIFSVFIPFYTQEINYGIVPFILALMFRSLYIYHINEERSSNGK